MYDLKLLVVGFFLNIFYWQSSFNYDIFDNIYNQLEIPKQVCVDFIYYNLKLSLTL